MILQTNNGYNLVFPAPQGFTGWSGTPTVYLSTNGSSFASSVTTTASSVTAGSTTTHWITLALNASDTGTTGQLAIHIDDGDNVFDYEGLTIWTALPANVEQWLGSAVTATSTVPDVNVHKWIGNSVSYSGSPNVNTVAFGGTAVTLDSGLPEVSCSGGDELDSTFTSATTMTVREALEVSVARTGNLSGVSGPQLRLGVGRTYGAAPK